MRILTINSGSSSIKLALFERVPELKKTGIITVDGIGGSNISLRVSLENGSENVKEMAPVDHNQALRLALDKLGSSHFDAVVHRVVFGGPRLRRTSLLVPSVLEQLHRMSSYDPDHMPFVLSAVDEISNRLPQATQVATFDSAFFADLPVVAKTLALPKKYREKGVEKFGYHGLSYMSLLAKLEHVDPRNVDGRIVMAHLGSGASLSAITNRRPIDTTMSFSPTSGIIMSTRSGDIDPLLASMLIEQDNLSTKDFADVVSHESGLMGISETTGDMYSLLQTAQSDSRAQLAIDSFCYAVQKAIGGLAATMGGIDMLVFSGGIGERSALIRSQICAKLGFLGIVLDANANQIGDQIISVPDSKPVWVIESDEASVMATEAIGLLDGSPK